MLSCARTAVLALVVHGVLADHPQPRRGFARPHEGLGVTAALQTGAAVVPPENVATTSHLKAPGGGYLAGSPLFGADPHAASVVTEEALPPIDAAGIFLPFCSLLFGILCLILVAMFNRGKGPVRDHESVMRTIFEKCDYHGAGGTVNKYALVRSIRAYQADNEGFLDLDQALQRIDASIDLEVSWNSFRALNVPNQHFVGERATTMPSTMGLTPMPVMTSQRIAVPSSYAQAGRERSMTMPASRNVPLAPPSVQINAPPSVRVAPPMSPGAPPSVQIQPVFTGSLPQQVPPQTGPVNWGPASPVPMQVQPDRSRAYTAAPTGGNWAGQPQAW